MKSYFFIFLQGLVMTGAHSLDLRAFKIHDLGGSQHGYDRH